MLDALLAALEYEHREWDKLIGKTLKLAHGFTLMDADVEMGDDERVLKQSLALLPLLPANSEPFVVRDDVDVDEDGTIDDERSLDVARLLVPFK